MESKLLEIFYDMSAIYGKSINVGFNPFKGKGIMVISRKKDIYMFLGGKYLIFPYSFSL
jgi:hypothetical protein